MKKIILFLALVLALFVIVLIINLVRGKSTLPAPSDVLQVDSPSVDEIVDGLAPKETE